MSDKELTNVLLLLQNRGWVKGIVWECMQTLKLRGLCSSSKLGTVSVVNQVTSSAHPLRPSVFLLERIQSESHSGMCLRYLAYTSSAHPLMSRGCGQRSYSSSFEQHINTSTNLIYYGYSPYSTAQASSNTLTPART